MAVTRLSGGLTPGAAGDPRTFPQIWNATADVIDGNTSGVSALDGRVTTVEGDVSSLETGFRLVGTRYFTSSGTFDKADPLGTGDIGLRAVRVRLVGGGGAGAGAVATGAGQVSGGGTGGGGGYSEKFYLAADLSSSETVTVGAAGAGVAGATGGAGGTSQFGSQTATGGGGGSAMSAPTSVNFAFGAGGAGGDGANADRVFSGQGGSGFFAVDPLRLWVGAGGNSPIAGGTEGSRLQSTSGIGFASSVNAIGCGGSNARNIESDATARAGGAGRPGICIVEVFV
jgi:hypothetical protein